MHILATYTGWKDFGGVMAPSKIVQTRGGWPFFEVDVTAAKANPADVATLVPAPAPAAGRGGPGGGGGACRGGAAARSDRHVRKARRRPLQAHHRSRQLRFGDRGVQGLHHDARGRTIRGACARVHRRNEEADPQQADPLRHEHASSLRSHRRAAGAGGRRRNDHHAEEQRGVLREGAQHAKNAAERHAREESEEGEDRSGCRRRRSTRMAREPSRCTTSLRFLTRTA